MDTKESSAQISISNVKIWQETPVQTLASAVNGQNVKKIEKLVKGHPEWLNYQEPQFGATLLFWAVCLEKYKSAKALLECGADPDIICTWEGGTALYRAAGYSVVDSLYKNDPEFVELLLAYGADPNIGFIGNDHNNSTEIGETPLIHSIGCGIEKTRALVEGGADINFRTKKGMTAAILSIWKGGPNATFEAMKYAHCIRQAQGHIAIK